MASVRLEIVSVQGQTANNWWRELILVHRGNGSLPIAKLERKTQADFETRARHLKKIVVF